MNNAAIRKTTSTVVEHQILKKRISLKKLFSILHGIDGLPINSLEKEIITKALQTGRNIKLSEYDLNTRHIEKLSKESRFPQVVLEFKKHYLNKGYALSTLEIQMRNLRSFIAFISKHFTKNENLDLNDMKALKSQIIILYEQHLVQRIHLGEIRKCSVYKYLVTVRLFVDMLRELGIVKINYVIPPTLIDQGKRANEYVASDEIVALIHSIENSSSRLKVRDMCLILLVMELGCRPIEVTNISLDDLRITERKITIACEKSGRRTLQISKDLTELLKRYLEIRARYEINHSILFVNHYGETMTPTGIASVFQRTNKKAFGEIRFNAKALRHTYATNALDNMNDFDQVSEAMGHKHRCSTEWYIHRSVQRMLNRTLPHNPLNHISEV